MADFKPNVFLDLKIAVQLKEGEAFSPETKMQILLNAGPDFTTQSLLGNAYSPNFDFDQVKSILNFVQDDVLKKVLAYVYCMQKEFHQPIASELKKYPNDQKKREEIVLGRAKTLFGSDERGKWIKKYKDQNEEITVTDGTTKSPVKIKDEYEKNINQIRYEKLSPAKVSFSVLSNGDLPPTGYPPK